VVRQSADEFILEKPLEDGSVAVGLFNLSDSSRKISVSLTELGLHHGYKRRTSLFFGYVLPTSH
jgi:hypothetical protein